MKSETPISIDQIKIDKSAFENLLDVFTDKISVVELKNYEIHLSGTVNIDVFNKSYKFENCTFINGRIDFYDFHYKNENKVDFHTVEFQDCEIQSDLYIKDCKLYKVNFGTCKISSKNFHISSSEITYIRFNASAGNYMEIQNLNLHQLNDKKTIVEFTHCDIGHLFLKNCDFKKTFFVSTITADLEITACNFLEEFVFSKSSIGQIFKIQKTSFHTSTFFKANLGLLTDFRNCDFAHILYFTDNNSIKATVTFDKCIFENVANFDNSAFSMLALKGVIFKDIVSLNNVHFNCSFILENTNFEKNVFFSKLLEMNSVQKFDLNTLRTLKTLLLKTDNKIDYNKVSAFEHRKYLQELKLSDSDYYILQLNNLSNKFGRSWSRGVFFTLTISLLFFLLLLTSNTFVHSTYPLQLYIDSEFAKGNVIILEYLKFTFSLGFTSPQFQSNGYLFLIFVIAKIFIGYGIYQTITAFRKFR